MPKLYRLHLPQAIALVFNAISRASLYLLAMDCQAIMVVLSISWAGMTFNVDRRP